MKRNLTLLLLVMTSVYAMAQNEDKKVAQSEDKPITLGEVVVKAAKVVNKIDGMVIYPTEVQKQSSSNGYGMLQKLSLPNIKIDAASHSVSAVDNRGEVQIRINGIIVSRQEMLSLDPKSISRINFINNPGVRYGDGIAYVIDIVTRRADNGYTVGTDLTATLTSPQGDGTAYGKWNKGKSELSLSYDFSGYKLKGMRNEERSDYTLNDGSIYSISRNDIATQRKRLDHDVKLTYNWADSTTCVFQASLSGSFSRTPDNYSVKEIADGDNRYTATSRESGNNSSPVVDLYFFRQITPRQSITANAVKELSDEATHKKFLLVRQEGSRKVKREIDHYNLDMIIALGYRVQSPVAVHFRRWATDRLHEYIQKGFAMDDERLKQGGNRYFRELLQRIRDIRSSERNFYQQVTDIYATSVDYDPRAKMTKLFFATLR